MRRFLSTLLILCSGQTSVLAQESWLLATTKPAVKSLGEKQKGPRLENVSAPRSKSILNYTPAFDWDGKDYSTESGSLTVAVQNSIEGRTYNVNNPSFGCKPDDSTSNVTCLRTIATIVNANGGGIVLFPGGLSNIYRISVGDPSVDTTSYTVIGNTKAVINFTASGTTVRLGSPDVRIRTITSYVTQATSGSPTPTATTATQQSLFYFGDGSTEINDIRIEGNDGQITLEVTGGAAFETAANSVNSFFFAYITNVRRLNIKDLRLDWRACVFSVTGVNATSGTIVSEIVEAVWDRVFVSYGSGGHDLGVYTEGRSTFRDGSFICPTGYCSKAIYIGGDRPFCTVDNMYFENVDNGSRNLKTAVAFFGENHVPGDDDVNHKQKIVNCTFNNCYWAINVELSETGRLSEEFIIANNIIVHKTGDGYAGMQIVKGRDTIVTGNTIRGYKKALDILGGQGMVLSNNALDECGGIDTVSLGCIHLTDSATAANSINDISIAGNTIRNIKQDGSGIKIAGSNVNVIGNVIDAGSNTGVTAIFCGTNNGTALNDALVQGNNISGVGTSTTYAFKHNNDTANNLRFKANNARFTTAGNLFHYNTTCNACVMEDNILITASGFTFTSSGLSSTWKFNNNSFTMTTGTGLSLRSTATYEMFKNTIVGTLTDTTGLTNRGMNSFNGNYEFVTITGATPTLLVGVYSEFRQSLSAASAPPNPTQMLDGQVIRFKFSQDATGGRVVTFPSKFSTYTCTNVALGTVVTALDTTASTMSVMTWKYDLAADKFYPMSCFTRVVP